MILRKLKYSSNFVERQSLLISRAFQDWRIAKENNDFNIFKNFSIRFNRFKKRRM